MKRDKSVAVKLREIRPILLAAISELDLRGADDQITKAMCIIDATFDAAISGKLISSDELFRRGMKLLPSNQR